MRRPHPGPMIVVGASSGRVGLIVLAPPLAGVIRGESSRSLAGVDWRPEGPAVAVAMPPARTV